MALAPGKPPCKPCWGGLGGSSILGKEHGMPCTFREKQLSPVLFDVL